MPVWTVHGTGKHIYAYHSALFNNPHVGRYVLVIMECLAVLPSQFDQMSLSQEWIFWIVHPPPPTFGSCVSFVLYLDLE